MYTQLVNINARPKPFEFYTAADLWTDEHTSKHMLSFHLNEEIDVSSRNAAFIERSVEWIATQFNVDNRTKIADFGCGPGLYASRLARKQAQVTGIDFSRRSIEYAREVANGEGLSIHYMNQNYLDFDSDDRFDLVLMIMCDFCALSSDQRKKMLTKFHSFLKPDGVVLLDVYSLSAFDQRKEVTAYEPNLQNGFWSPNQYYGFLNTFKYEKEKVILDKYTLIEASCTRTVYNWLQYFSPESLEELFTECGFTIEKLYSDVAGTPYDPGYSEIAVVARKS